MIQLVTAKRCAWRAAYIHVGPMNRDGFRSRQVAHLGIDPMCSTDAPELFGRLGSWHFRTRLPRISWIFVVRSGYSPVVMKLYKLQQSFWHGLDGRYGWGTKP